MRRERPDVAFEVAEDIPGGRGTKRFTFFAAVEEFFRLKHIHVCSLVVQLSQEAPLDFLQGHYKLIQLLDALCLRLEQ